MKVLDKSSPSSIFQLCYPSHQASQPSGSAIRKAWLEQQLHEEPNQ